MSSSAKGLKGERSIVPIRKLLPGECAPLSYAQLRLWYLDQIRPGNPAYNVRIALNLKGPLRVDLLQWSLNQVVARHDGLRSVFATVDGQPAQTVLPPALIALPVVDLENLPAARRDQEHKRLNRAFARFRFDLKRKYLFRILLIRLAPQQHTLLVNFHHIICDGWSVGRFANELSCCYRALVAEAPPLLPDLPIQYADYAAWQQSLTGGKAFERQLHFWKQQLANAPASLYLPTDRSRHATRPSRGARQSLVISQDLMQQVAALSRRQGVTVFMLMLAAMQALLYRWSGQSDLVIGTVVANRNRAEIEPLIGCFMEILPIRVIIQKEQTAKELLQQARDALIDAYANQDCSLMNIVKAIDDHRAQSQTPLYNVALLGQNFARGYDFGDTLEVRSLPKGMVRNPELDLRFSIAPRLRRQHMSVACEYKSELFDAETIQQLLENYCRVLTGFIEDLNRKVADIELTEPLTARAAAARARDEISRLSIAASFNAEPLGETLAFWIEELGLATTLQFAAEGKLLPPLAEQANWLTENEPGVKVILLRLEDWITAADEGQTTAEGDWQERLAEKAEAFAEEMTRAMRGAKNSCLLCFCPASSEAAGKLEAAACFKQLEESLAARLASVEGLYTLTSSRLADYYPVARCYEPAGDQPPRLAYTESFFAGLGTMIARRLYALAKRPLEALVLNGDGALWGGKVADDGPLGVKIEAGHLALQAALIDLRQSGIPICLCQPGGEEAVFAVLDQRPEMRLKRDHVAAWRINGQRPSENLASLAEELALGVEKLMFIAADPDELAEVVAGCPELEICELPQDESGIAEWLKHNWDFDRFRVRRRKQRLTAHIISETPPIQVS